MNEAGVYFTVDRDGLSQGLQISIEVVGADGGGHGYRIAGPKYNGSSKTLKRHIITARDITEIEQYLAKAKSLLSAP